MNEPRQPRPDEAVLGGQFLAPLDGTVLGGLEGVEQRFEWGILKRKNGRWIRFKRSLSLEVSMILSWVLVAIAISH